jgi:hypothetical protein
MYAGQFLAKYLRASHLPAQWPFIADLANLERALIDSFHAAGAAVLDRAAVQAILPEEWPRLIIRLHPATQLLRLQWRVDEIISAAAQDKEPMNPVAEAVTVIVWRKRGRVFYRAAEAHEAIALKLAERGCEFATICDVLAAELNADNLPNVISRLLNRWLDDDLFANGMAIASSRRN